MPRLRIRCPGPMRSTVLKPGKGCPCIHVALFVMFARTSQPEKLASFFVSFLAEQGLAVAERQHAKVVIEQFAWSGSSSKRHSRIRSTSLSVISSFVRL